MEIEKRIEIINLFEKYNGFLTQTQKQAMHLYYIEDLSLREVSEIVATTRNSVYDAIQKGQAKLIKVETQMKKMS